MTTWLVCVAIAAVLGLATWGFAREASREMPPYPSSPVPLDRMPKVPSGPAHGWPERPWQPDPSRFGRCPSCGTLRPLDDDGMVAAHDRPEPQVPFNVQSFPCRGAGQAPMQAEASER
jgi:hypothetical protein